MRDPALVLGSELSGSANATHAEDDGLESENPCIITHILIGGTFGASIGGMKIEGLVLINAVCFVTEYPAVVAQLHADIIESAVYFIGGCDEKDGLNPGPSCGFEGIEGAQRVHFKINARIGDGSGDGCLAGGVDDDRAIGKGRRKRLGIA